MSNAVEVSILKFNMARKVAFGTTPNPEQTEGFTEYRVYALNQNHSKRTLIFKGKDKQQAKDVVDEISKNLGYSYVQYNPPKSKGRRNGK